MCKLFMIVGLKNETQSKLAWKLTETIAPLISKHDNHGIGYMSVTRQGVMFSEKWLKNDDFLKPMSNAYRNKIEALSDMVDQESNDNYKCFPQDLRIPGQRKNSAIIALHTRYATCGKNIDNTHPFVETATDDAVVVGLIHNGVIHNDHKFQKRQSTCDSEVILTQYIDNACYNDAKRIPDAIKDLSGYFACGILQNGSIDVFKSHSAQLHVAFAKELDSYIYSTSKEALQEAAHICKITLSNIYSVKSGVITRHDLRGRVIEQCTFREPQSYTHSSYTPSWTERLKETKKEWKTPTVDKDHHSDCMLYNAADPWDSDAELGAYRAALARG